MTQRAKIQIFIGLLVLAVVAYLYSRTSNPSTPSVLSADTRFEPLNVKEPALRIDMMQKVQKDEYTGAHRNIFLAAPPPPPPGEAHAVEVSRPFVGPMVPPPPPPLQVPVEFYGYESSGVNGKRVAFLKDGDDVLVVREGDTFMNRFRLAKIGNDSADVEEVSSGRHASLPLVQPQDPGQSQN